jgi:putative ABC transport system permease protein
MALQLNSGFQLFACSKNQINKRLSFMIKNYLITAFRNLVRSKGSAFINLSGLTLGISASLVLFLIVRHLDNFDRFHHNNKNIYRVATEFDDNNSGGKEYQSGIPSVLPDAFKIDFPEAKEVTHVQYENGGVISIPQTNGDYKKYAEKHGIVFIEPNFFKVFDRKVLLGDATKALDEPNEAIISHTLAIKYFGKQDAIGEIFRYELKDYKVSAIVEDAPNNTDLPFDIMLSYVTIKVEREKNGWHSIWSDDQCYILVDGNDNLQKIKSRLPEFGKKYLGEDAKVERFILQPFEDVHYDDRFSNYNYNTVSKAMLSVFAVIAVFLIITACINFINLSTAEAIKRSKEVSIRKTMGSTRGQLIIQFLGEATLVSLAAMLLGLVVTEIALKFLNPFLDMHLQLNFKGDWGLWVFIFVVLVIVSLLSGLYPSFVLSGFDPIAAMKNKISNKNSSGFMLRRALVVLQFCISQFFIIGTIVLISQMSYFRNKELGFAKEAIITISLPNTKSVKTLRDEVSSIPGVEMVSLSNSPPSSGNVNATGFKTEDGKEYGAQIKLIDSNYIPLYQLTLLAGENVPDLDSAQGFIVNEKLAKMIGYHNPSEAVGKRLDMWNKKLPIIGVVKDFHTVSLHQTIDATALFNHLKGYRSLSVKVNRTKFQEAIKQIQQKWDAAYPEFLFEYSFMDEQIKNFYEREEKMSALLTVFTSIAIFIGCLGLFGLATFMANQKTKEIGVRKVLGASVESIVFSFSKEYVKLIGIGFFLAAPAAWYIMNQWLNGFAYKITLGPSIFVTGLLATFSIAVVTVGYRSYKAATVNPAQSLKSE